MSFIKRILIFVSTLAFSLSVSVLVRAGEKQPAVEEGVVDTVGDPQHLGIEVFLTKCEQERYVKPPEEALKLWRAAIKAKRTGHWKRAKEFFEKLRKDYKESRCGEVDETSMSLSGLIDESLKVIECLNSRKGKEFIVATKEQLLHSIVEAATVPSRSGATVHNRLQELMACEIVWMRSPGERGNLPTPIQRPDVIVRYLRLDEGWLDWEKVRPALGFEGFEDGYFVPKRNGGAKKEGVILVFSRFESGWIWDGIVSVF